MANVLYDAGRAAFANAAVDWDTDTIKMALVTSGYTFSQTHDFFNDVTNVITTATLASCTNTGGILDAADTVLTSVAGGSTGAYIVIYKSTGTDATSALLLYLDTFTSGMPVVTNGGNITIQWDNGTNKIFKL